MKETTSSKISWPNATSRSCPFEGTVLERKRERERERKRKRARKEREEDEKKKSQEREKRVKNE